MPGDDDAPLSSYSDPLYDRLDAMARHIKRMWWIFALGLIAVIVASIAVRMWLYREPSAVGAAVALAAREATDDAKRAALWQELADGPRHDPGFRAAACIELAQIRLAAGDAIKARAFARQAEELAKLANDTDLRLGALLSQAAIDADGGEFATALEQYEKCSKAAGQQYPARRMAAELGAARCLEKQGKIEDAIQRLEPLTTRTDSGAGQLIELATATYWRLKRQQATPPAPAKPAADAKPAETPAPAPAADAKPVEKPAAPAAPATPAAR